MRLRLIGQMEAWTIDSQSVLPVGRKTRALLAILALSSPRPVLRGRLAEMLWSRRPEEQARASLRQEIHRLLGALGAVGQQVVLVHRDTLSLRQGSTWVDVEEVLRATPGKPAALSLLDGELLEDLDGVDSAFDAWLVGERARLRDKARGLAETVLRDQAEPDGTIRAAKQLLTIDRTHEGGWRALIGAYMASGERGMAIQAFERCRSVLSDQLDTQPSEDTQRLVSDIRASGSPRAAIPVPRAEQRAEQRPGAGREARGEPRAEAASERRGEPAPAALQRVAPRVGVMPLQLAGTTEAEAPLGTGLAEEITAALARCRWMFLVSSSALARFTAQTRDETAIRRAFDIQFLLDGSIQRVEGRLRIALRILDLRAGNQVVWSRRFDRAAADLLTLQDEVAAEAAAQIDPELLLIESHRASARPSTDGTGYDLVLRALSLMDRLDRRLFMQAGDLLRQAIKAEPDYAAACAWFAYWHVLLVSQDWIGVGGAQDSFGQTSGTLDITHCIAEAGRLAERAIVLDPQDARGLTVAGHVRAVLDRRLREAIALHERALTLNPNLAMAWALSGIAHAYTGDLAEAERRLQRYKKLSPLDPRSYLYDTGFCLVALLKGEFPRAATIGRGVSEMNPAFSAACKPYLAALGHLRQDEETATVRRRLLTLEPGFTVQRFLGSVPLQVAAHRQTIASGLRAAGVPDS